MMTHGVGVPTIELPKRNLLEMRPALKAQFFFKLWVACDTGSSVIGPGYLSGHNVTMAEDDQERLIALFNDVGQVAGATRLRQIQPGSRWSSEEFGAVASAASDAWRKLK